MSTTALTEHTPAATDTAETATPRITRGPIVRVVLGALLIGLVGAAALTLVGFRGAP
jgi:hypothetical protein